MLKPLAAIIAAMVLTACQMPSDTGTITQSADTITISNNLGGNNLAFIAKRRDLAASGKRVVISGYCASACTILYSLPNACMEAGSSLHFHGSSGPFGVINQALGAAQMSAYYRAGIKAQYLADWQKYSHPMRAVTREEAIALDPEIKRCED